jgi:squalene synthase HpnD
MTLAVTASSQDASSQAQVAAGSSFYLGMRVLPKPERAAMFAVYGFCRIVDDIADDQTLPIEVQRASLDAWRADLEALYAGRDPGRAAMLKEAVSRYRLDKEDFLALIDGMQMDLEGVIAPDLATMLLYCDRVAVAVGRLSVKVFGMPAAAGEELAHHLGRALQLTNILRDVDEDAEMGRLYLPEEYLRAAGVESRAPSVVAASPAIEAVCERLADMAEDHFGQARRVLAAKPRGHTLAPRLMAVAYAALLARLRTRGWAPPRQRVRVAKGALVWLLLRRGLVG